MIVEVTAGHSRMPDGVWIQNRIEELENETPGSTEKTKNKHS